LGGDTAPAGVAGAGIKGERLWVGTRSRLRMPQLMRAGLDPSGRRARRRGSSARWTWACSGQPWGLSWNADRSNINSYLQAAVTEDGTRSGP